jgi:hypothetical protein
MKGKWHFSDQYRSPLRDSLVLQAFFLIFSSLAFDGGMMLGNSLVALAPCWSLTLLVLLRRPSTPTPLDLKVVRFGYLASWILLILLSPLLALMTG